MKQNLCIDCAFEPLECDVCGNLFEPMHEGQTTCRICEDKPLKEKYEA